MRRVLGVLGVVILVGAGPASAQLAREVQVSAYPGGSVTTELSRNIKVNPESSLERSWVVLNDPTSPIQLSGAGIETLYRDSRYSLRPTGTFTATAPVVAFEIRYALYDMFGQHIKTLTGTEVRDVDEGESLPLSPVGTWHAFEDEVRELLTVVAFVSAVRPRDGEVWTHDQEAVLDRLREVELQVSDGVLSPAADGS